MIPHIRVWVDINCTLVQVLVAPLLAHGHTRPPVHHTYNHKEARDRHDIHILSHVQPPGDRRQDQNCESESSCLLGIRSNSSGLNAGTVRATRQDRQGGNQAILNGVSF